MLGAAKLRKKLYATLKEMTKRLPLPISLSTLMFPPCASTKSLDMANPKPLP